MTSGARAWPGTLGGTPGAAVLDQAIGAGRLSRGILLECEDLDLLVELALAVADRLLHPPGAARTYPVERHPDCFHLRPTGKSRTIDVESVRGLIGSLQRAASIGRGKVALLHEADRMQASGANALLKVLEEPPPDTTLLLLSTRPYALLPTIRSRVLHFRFPASGAVFAPEGWPAWVADYRAWLRALGSGQAKAAARRDSVLGVYGLVARFDLILARATDGAWEGRKEQVPEGLEDEEVDAIKAGLSVGLRARVLAEIALATREHAREALLAGTEGAARDLVSSLAVLEHDAGLLRFNMNELAVLEDFLLAVLRHWGRA